jgi:hypothetical protein
VIPPWTGNCSDCTGNTTCNPYSATFAVPLDLYNTNQANLPYRAIGKVFFTSAGRNFTCSGASIGGSAVLTAGHCVSDGQGNFYTNWVFVPDFYVYTTPEASPWVATQLMTFPAFLNDTDLARDVGFAVVEGPASANGATLSEVLGHLGFAWNLNPTGVVWNAFGYPILVYGGLIMVQTDAVTACRDQINSTDPQDVGIGRTQTGGGSGGPWIFDFRATLTDLSMNYAGGVNSFVSSGGGYQVYSPYFDQAVKNLKDQAVAAKP